MTKITVITVSYNSAKTIKETIESVLSQDYPLIEYIIIDGQSVDSTPDIIRSFGSKISRFISEKDNGLYDAMNKAIDLATGEIVGILNSDDLYASKHVLSTVATEFQTKNVDSVFGDLYYFKTSDSDKAVRVYKGKYFNRSMIRFGILPPHPTFFVRREMYLRFGKFDLQYKYASDFDLMARFFFVHNISYSYVPMLMVKMRLGGVSTGSFLRIIQINKEDIRSCLNNGIPTNFLLFHLKYVWKIVNIRNPFGLIKTR